MEWFEGKPISVFRQIYHVEFKDIGFSSPAKREQALWISIAPNPGFSQKTSAPQIDSDVFSTETEIKTSDALGKN